MSARSGVGWRFRVALLIVLALGLLLRSVHLVADPPHDLAYGGIAEFTDEGFKTYHARNYVLFGNWLWHPGDEYRFWIRQSPASLALHAAWFRATGRVDIASARALHILASLAGILAWALLVRRERGPGIALASAAILSGCYVGVMYDRLALTENLLPVLVAGMLWLALPSARPGWRTAAAALLAVTAMLFKSSAALVLAAGGAGLAWHLARARAERTPEARARRLAALGRVLAAAGVLAVGLYVLLLVRPDLTPRIGALAERSPIASPASLLRNLSYVQFATKLPFLLFVAVISAWRELTRPWDTSSVARTLPAVSASWLLLGIAILALFEGNGDRIRYYTILLPPMSLLVAEEAARHVRGGRPAEDHRSLGIAARACGVAVGASAVAMLAVGIYHQCTTVETRLALVSGLRAAGGGAAVSARLLAGPVAAAAIYLACLAAGWWAWKKGAGRAVVALLLLLSVAVEVRQWLPWLAGAPAQMQAVRADLAARLPPDAVLAGQWAPALALGTSLRCLPLHVRTNIDEGRLALLAPTHVLVNDDRPEEREAIDRDYPGLLTPASEVARYRVARFVLHLHRVTWHGAPEPGGAR